MVPIQTIRQRKSLERALSNRHRQHMGNSLIKVVVVLVGIAVLIGLLWSLAIPQKA